MAEDIHGQFSQYLVPPIKRRCTKGHEWLEVHNSNVSPTASAFRIGYLCEDGSVAATLDLCWRCWAEHAETVCGIVKNFEE